MNVVYIAVGLTVMLLNAGTHFYHPNLILKKLFSENEMYMISTLLQMI